MKFLPALSSFRRATLAMATATACCLTPHVANAVPDELLAIHAVRPKLELGQLVYQHGKQAQFTLRFDFHPDVQPKEAKVLFVSDDTGDIEVVDLNVTEFVENSHFIAVGATPVPLAAPGAETIPLDGTLEVPEGGTFHVFLHWQKFDEKTKTWQDLLAGDWAIIGESAPSSGMVKVEPTLMLSEDEANPPDGAPPFGTLLVAGDVGPVQVASNQLLYFPSSQEELDRFTDRTGAQLIGYEGLVGKPGPQDKAPEPGTAWFIFEVEGDEQKIPQLPTLRNLLDQKEPMFASSTALMALVATATELWMEGFQVALNPRIEPHIGFPSPEGIHQPENLAESPFRLDPLRNSEFSYREPAFLLNEVQIFMELFDFDTEDRHVPVAVIDFDYAHNPDFKTTHPLYLETNLNTGVTGVGSAQTPLQYGKFYHGNASLLTIGAAPGNRFGYSGVASRVAVPRPYLMSEIGFAFEGATAIRRAVNDGASVVSISAGFPCRILGVLGADDICSREGRTAFIAKLGLKVRAAAALVCVASPILDIFFPGASAIACITAQGAAETAAMAAFGTVFAASPVGPFESAVAHATAAGVTVVASAGNPQSSEALGPLAPFVDLSNTNMEDWRVVPAIIPGVIAVGGCDGWYGRALNRDNPAISNVGRRNLYFWGDRVDIWAPTGYWFFQPPTSPDRLPGLPANPALLRPEHHVLRDYNGTSCAAAYVSGVIANLMAIDRSLDPRAANPATRPTLPGRIRNLLVDNAWPAGSIHAPSSAAPPELEIEVSDGVFEPLPPGNIPQRVLDELDRRRNLIAPWRTVRQVARNIGLLEYETLGFHEFHRSDRFPAATPHEISLESTLTAEAADSIGLRDLDLFSLRLPPEIPAHAVRMYDAWVDVEIPAREVDEARTIVRLNDALGSIISRNDDVVRLGWRLPPTFAGRSHRLTLGASGVADSIYRATFRRSIGFIPARDRYDLLAGANNRPGTAIPMPSSSPTNHQWVEIAPFGGVEDRAFKLDIPNLNLHAPTDEDWFLINFPSPPLTLPPPDCGALSPTLDVSISSEHSRPYLQVIHIDSAGRQQVLRAGVGGVRLTCRDYQGRLPFYLRVWSREGLYSAYNLHLRWGEPSKQFNDTAERIREFHAGGREIPKFAFFLPPDIPFLTGSIGRLPPSVVNPDPRIQQDLGNNGQFLASRLFLVEVPGGPNSPQLPISFMATIPISQSLRMELVSMDEQILGDAFWDGSAPLGIKDAGATTRQLLLDFPNVSPGVYFLRLSGHGPGDDIGLALSRNLIRDGSFSVEGLMGIETGEGGFVQMSSEFDDDGEALSGLDSRLEIHRAARITFDASPDTDYQIFLNRDDLWTPYDHPVIVDAPGEVSLFVPTEAGDNRVLIAKPGSPDLFAPGFIESAIRLRYHSRPETWFTLERSPDLDFWKDFDEYQPLLGDGGAFQWFFDPLQPAEFFRAVTD